MKRLIVVAGVVMLGLSAGLVAQEAAQAKKIDVTGTWEISMEGPEGPMTLLATYKQEGEKLTGTQSNPMGGEDKLEGTVENGTIEYVLHVDMGGQQVSIGFSGKVDGDSITGTVTLGDMGSSNWSAKRKK